MNLNIEVCQGTVTGRFSSTIPATLSVPPLTALVRRNGLLYRLDDKDPDLLDEGKGTLEQFDSQGLVVAAHFWAVLPAGYPPSFKPQRADVVAQLADMLDSTNRQESAPVAFEVIPESLMLVRAQKGTGYNHHVQVRLYRRT